MKCNQIEDLISQYIDGELDKETRESFEKHIASCESCKEEFVLMKNTMEMCREMDEVDLPYDFGEKLHERLVDEKARMSQNRIIRFVINYGRQISSVAAAVMLVFMVKVFVLDRNLTMENHTNEIYNSAAQEKGGDFGSKSIIAYDSLEESESYGAGKAEEGQWKSSDMQNSEVMNEHNKPSLNSEDSTVGVNLKERDVEIKVTGDKSDTEIGNIKADEEFTADISKSSDAFKAMTTMTTSLVAASISISTSDLDKDVDILNNLAQKIGVPVVVYTNSGSYDDDQNSKNIITSFSEKANGKTIPAPDSKSRTLNYKVEYSKYHEFLNLIRKQYDGKIEILDPVSDNEMRKQEIQKILGDKKSYRKEELDNLNKELDEINKTLESYEKEPINISIILNGV